MNVIRQNTRGAGAASTSNLTSAGGYGRGRGRGAVEFELIQFRPQVGGEASSSSLEMRTPSNLLLKMAITTSARRDNSSSTPCVSSDLTSSASNVQEQYQNFRTPCPTPRSRSRSHRGARSRPMVTPLSSASYSGEPQNTPQSHVVLAITEGRGHARGEVGMAVIDVKRPCLILCQLSDRQTYVNTLTKINVFHPVEILVPHTFIDGNQPNKLYHALEENFPHVSKTKVQRRFFKDSDGMEKLHHLALPESASCQLVVKEKFYALAATAALLRYVEFVQNVIFAPKSLKVEYQGAQHGTIIDVRTAQALELLLNREKHTADYTLVAVLDHCCTHGGSRLLRASLLHPPCSLPTIIQRQDSVQELVEDRNISQQIREVLKQIPDVEQLLTLCMQTPYSIDTNEAIETRMNYVLLLKSTLDILPQLWKVIENSKSYLLCRAKACLQDPRRDLIRNRILDTLNEDVKAPKGSRTATYQRCFAVKSGINEFMDVARKTYCELITDMRDHVIRMESDFSLPLKMNYSVTKGYHVIISPPKNRTFKESDLPRVFVQVQRSRNSISCTTDTLIHANERIKHVSCEILTMSNTLLTILLNDIRPHISYLYNMCESIAELDITLAMSQISSSHDYVRPQFGDRLQVKAARHPILESISACDPIPNNVEASNFSNLSIITGPNMSGKSIYIKQVLLLQIMAQIGCYVPAEEATFRISDRIFSHLIFDDSIECNASTLSLEMQEIHLILSSLTATSLVALDELCRGTSVEEGSALAWALCEELSQTTAYVFVTTHFVLLAQLASIYPCIRNLHLETVEQAQLDGKTKLLYTHRLIPGINPVKNYGLRLAETLNMPKSVLEEAWNIASQIEIRSQVHLSCEEGDEAYTLFMAFEKLKVMSERDGLSSADLLNAQQEMKEAIEASRIRNEALVVDMLLADEIPEASSPQENRIVFSPVSNTHVVDDVDDNKVKSHAMLCADYLSSDFESPIREPVAHCDVDRESNLKFITQYSARIDESAECSPKSLDDCVNASSSLNRSFNSCSPCSSVLSRWSQRHLDDSAQFDDEIDCDAESPHKRKRAHSQTDDSLLDLSPCYSNETWAVPNPENGNSPSSYASLNTTPQMFLNLKNDNGTPYQDDHLSSSTNPDHIFSVFGSQCSSARTGEEVAPSPALASPISPITVLSKLKCGRAAWSGDGNRGASEFHSDLRDERMAFLQNTISWCVDSKGSPRTRQGEQEREAALAPLRGKRAGRAGQFEPNLAVLSRISSEGTAQNFPIFQKAKLHTVPCSANASSNFLQPSMYDKRVDSNKHSEKSVDFPITFGENSKNTLRQCGGKNTVNVTASLLSIMNSYADSDTDCSD